MKKLLNQLLPFVFIGIAVVAFIFGIMILAYLFLFGAIIGIILFIVSWVREKLFHHKSTKPPKQQGRIIDTDDWKKL